MKKIIMTDGVWDLLHYNHVEYLVEAKALGTYLIAGVVSDKMAISYKRKPILNEQERMQHVQAMPFVDEVFLFDGPLTPENFKTYLDHYKPDVFVSASIGWDEIYAPAIEQGIFVRWNYRPGISTSEIIKRIIARRHEFEGND